MKETFGWIDYTLFLIMLAVSSGMGIYHGVYKKQRTANDYLLGGKRMSVWPVAMSLISSTLSGISLLSQPADVYRYGIPLMLTLPCHIPVIAAACYIYIPVFYELQITSIYEYLEMRYNNKIRTFASFMYVVHAIFLLPIYIYVPALALTQVSDISVHWITPVVCAVCIFYTTLGGIKAAVWTDAFQFITMFGSLVLVVAVGVISNGGFGNIFEKFSAGERMNISFDASLTDRNTLWAVTIGASFATLNHMAVNQSFVQKCLTLPTYGSIKRVLFLVTIGVMVIIGLSMFSGLVMFAYYFGCDPLKANAIKTYDQLLPMYVMEAASFIPGLPGLFISGIFSASFSSLSAYLNCTAAIIYKDFISPLVPESTPDVTVSKHLKLLVVGLGILCTALVYVVEKLGSLLALTFSVSAISGGPLLGLFTAGMLIPMIHTKGALYGAITSVIITSWIIGGAQWYKFKGALHPSILPVSTDACNATIPSLVNQTLTTTEIAPVNIDVGSPDSPFVLYRLSFFYYVITGVLITIIVSAVVSYFTKRDKPLDRQLLSPVVRSWIKHDDVLSSYNTVEKAIELGALYGAITSVIITSWIIGGAQWYKFKGALHPSILPVSTDACNATIPSLVNQTLTTTEIAPVNIDVGSPDSPFVLYRLSFFYYVITGVLITIIVSAVVSYFTKRDKPLDRQLLSPVVRSWIKHDDVLSSYNTVEKAIELVK